MRLFVRILGTLNVPPSVEVLNVVNRPMMDRERSAKLPLGYAEVNTSADKSNPPLVKLRRRYVLAAGVTAATSTGQRDSA